MKLETMISVRFTQEEVIEALLGHLDCERNDAVYGAERHTTISNIIERARENTMGIDFVDGEFVLMIDGSGTENL